MIDEQEALSIKYTAPTVAALESGKFAVFGPFDNMEGLPLKIICSFEELWEALREQQADNTAEPREFKLTPIENPILKGIMAKLLKPEVPVARRR